MRINLADWEFLVDTDATAQYTTKCSQDHCLCPYCKNFYETVDKAHPGLRPFLQQFGVFLDGPCELMPFAPTLLMACYRITGRILHAGQARMHINGIPLIPEAGDENTFLLWVGEMELPWIQQIPEDEVLSPANEPEFLRRMEQKWLETRDCSAIM